MNYYPFHIGDFRSGTSNMSRPTRWIYRDMLDVYYDKEQPLPLDHEKLFDELGVEAEDERRIVERLLRFKFIKTDNGYRHEICDEVIGEYHKKAETARANGGKGGRPRKPAPPQDDPNGNPDGSGNNPAGFDQVPNGSPVGTGLKTNQEPITKNKGKPKPSSSAGADGDGGPKVKPFEQFWTAYPKKVAKIEAQKAWTALKLDAQVDAIVAAVVAQIDGHEFRRDDGQFIPHPGSWLRAGRWLDVVQAWVEPPPKLPGGWWADPDLMKQAGLMLNPPLEPRPNEGQKAFAHRIRVAIGQADETPRPAELGQLVFAPYVPPAPPPEVHLTEEQRQARRDQLREAMAKLKQSSPIAGVRPNHEPEFSTTEGEQ